VKGLTRKALLLGAFGALLVIAGSTAQAGWLFVLAAGVFGLIAGSVLGRHRLAQMDVRRDVPARARVGDDVRVVLEVVNRGSVALPPLRMEDRYGAFECNAIVVEPLPPGALAAVELVRHARTRGMFAAGKVDVMAAAPFGIRRSRRAVDVVSSSTIVPRWVELRSFPILEPSSYPHEELHERARIGAGEEYLGVREYRAGDPIRTVHWKTSARAGHLVVREFEQEASSHVVVVLAGTDHGEPPDSSYETLVSAAASVARYALVTGHPVDLVRPTGDGDVERVRSVDAIAALDWLATARPYDADLTPLVTVALARARRRSTIVVMAPTTGRAGASFVDAMRAVQSAGSRAIAVAARASSWEARHAEGDGVIDALRGGRAATRVLYRDGDLRRCLEA
jgi:uncharacterized protein (DUF58 family)